MEGSCVHSNELMNFWGLHNRPKDYWFLKKNSALWSWLILNDWRVRPNVNTSPCCNNFSTIIQLFICSFRPKRVVSNAPNIRAPSLSPHGPYKIISFTGRGVKLTNWVVLEKPPVAQLLKHFPTFYETRRFSTVFTRALHWSLSWASWIQPIIEEAFVDSRRGVALQLGG
jgi:hypothetical protein